MLTTRDGPAVIDAKASVGRKSRFLGPSGGRRTYIAIRFGMEKLEWCEKKFETMFSCFDKIHERDRQANRQTDKYRTTAQAALMHSIALQKNRCCRFKTAKFTNEQR